MRRITIAMATGLALACAAAASPAEAAYPSGDVNHDCTVNSTDLRLVADRYGATYGSLRYVASYDLNGDRRIGVADLQMVAAQFGAHCT